VKVSAMSLIPAQKIQRSQCDAEAVE
jgi:hypothetical protein